jgi:hypothetical protein
MLSMEKALVDQCVALNNGLQQIRARSNQVKACITSMGILPIKQPSISVIPGWITPRELTPSRYT